jgi:riboflavin synthase
MFTGIIECLGSVQRLEEQGSNLLITIKSEISSELKVDQSLAHDGVCLTVVAVEESCHQVVAVQETLSRSTFRLLQVGQLVNLERALVFGGRLDGHLVQGHVDQIGHCLHIEEVDGSHIYTFSYPAADAALVINKGSIAVNGISLTLVDPTDDQFKVAIIPYTWRHTTFRTLKVGDPVNLEYDIMGKYFSRMMEVYGKKAAG